MHALQSCSYMTLPRDQNKYSDGITDDKSCRSSLGNGSHKISTQNRYAKTYLGYFDKASGCVGGVSMWSSGL